MALLCSFLSIALDGTSLLDTSHYMEFEPRVDTVPVTQERRTLRGPWTTHLDRGNLSTTLTFSRVANSGNLVSAMRDSLNFSTAIEGLQGDCIITLAEVLGGHTIPNAVVTSFAGRVRSSLTYHTITIRGGEQVQTFP